MVENEIKIIERIPLWENKVSIKTLSGGITNFNYLVTDGRKKYVARFAPTSNRLLGLDRRREIKNTAIAYALGIGPKIVKFFPQHSLLIVEYLEGPVLTVRQGKRRENIKRLARLFKKLHHGPKFTGTSNPFKVSRGYIAAARSRKSWLPVNIGRSLEKLSDIEAMVKPFRQDIPCHLDLMIGNVIGVGRTVKLIDWEYAANADPRFDLAMFSIKAHFTARHDALLLKEYGLKISQREFEAMKAIVYFREAAWGLLQLAISKITFDYKKYAMENLAEFNAIADRLVSAK